MGFFHKIGQVFHKGVKTVGKVLKGVANVGGAIGTTMQIAAPIAAAAGAEPLAAALLGGGTTLSAASHKFHDIEKAAHIGKELGKDLSNSFRGKGTPVNVEDAQKRVNEITDTLRGVKDAAGTIRGVGRDVYDAGRKGRMSIAPPPPQQSVVRAYQETPNQVILTNKIGSGFKRGTSGNSSKKKSKRRKKGGAQKLNIVNRIGDQA